MMSQGFEQIMNLRINADNPATNNIKDLLKIIIT